MLKDILTPEQMLLIVEKNEVNFETYDNEKLWKCTLSFKIIMKEEFKTEDLQVILVSHALTIEALEAGVSNVEDFKNALKLLVALNKKEI